MQQKIITKTKKSYAGYVRSAYLKLTFYGATKSPDFYIEFCCAKVRDRFKSKFSVWPIYLAETNKDDGTRDVTVCIYQISTRKVGPYRAAKDYWYPKNFIFDNSSEGGVEFPSVQAGYHQIRTRFLTQPSMESDTFDYVFLFKRALIALDINKDDPRMPVSFPPGKVFDFCTSFLGYGNHLHDMSIWPFDRKEKYQKKLKSIVPKVKHRVYTIYHSNYKKK